MKRSDVFKSRFLQSDDVPGTGIDVVIEKVELVEMTGDDQDKVSKAVVFFKGWEKGLVLNQTNWDRIAKLHGEDTDGWTGKTVTLTLETATFKGKSFDAIRVKI